MDNPLVRKSWSPYVVGASIGVLSWFSFWSADKPLGITTPMEHTAALVEAAIIPNFEQTNPYYAAQAKEGRSPKIGWEWMLVLGVFFGALLSATISGDRSKITVPEPWRRRFGDSVTKRMVAAFIGGAMMLFGARLAQGCTSGHGISGTLQLAASSWVFTIVFFAIAIGVALLIYGREEMDHV
jgi:uncharacterized protein